MALKDKDLLALAALLHDIGKFGQRAKIDWRSSAFNKNTYNHTHAAYTAQILTDYFAFNDTYKDYSAMHHNVQATSGDDEYWIIASADRLASGFEREKANEIDGYKDWENEDFRTQRLRSLFDENNQEYGIQSLSSEAIFCTEQKSETNEYIKAWQNFEEELNDAIVKDKEQKTKKIGNDSTDLATIDYLLKKHTTFMPSSTTFKKGDFEPVKANIPLYDHLKTTAVFASAIDAMESDQKDNILNYYKKQNCDINQKDFLLIAGDFFGIQEFIFDNIQASKASKLLRAKSAFVQVLTKVLAFSLSDGLDLSRLAIISDSAGKFEILAPNNQIIKDKIKQFQKDLNKHFKKEFFAQTGVGVSYQECSIANFLLKDNNQEKSPYQVLRDNLAEKVELDKFNKFDLQQEQGFILELDKDLDNQSLCQLCEKRKIFDKDKKACKQCAKFVKVGESLVKDNFVVIGQEIKSDKKINIFANWDIIFINNKDGLKSYKDTIAIYDISNKDEFQGYAKWESQSYVAKDEKNKILEFSELAKNACGANTEKGVKALMAVKADVDDMGKFIRWSKTILKSNTPINHSFAKFNFFSRIIDYFFSVYVPFRMQKDFPDTYTIFAGGDDLFLIGAWDEVINLNAEIRKEFRRFCNEKLSLSAGLLMFKEHTPINYIAHKSEEVLDEKTKKYTDKETKISKNALTLFNQTTSFEVYNKMKKAFEPVQEIANEYKEQFGTAFWYRLIELCEMREALNNPPFKPEKAMWKSKLHYSFQRNIIDKTKDKDDKLKQIKQDLEQIIDQYGGNLKIVIFEHLYKHRKQ